MNRASLQHNIQRLKISVDKRYRALSEEYDLEQYVRASIPPVEATPFPHVVVDNFFQKAVHDQLVSYYKKILARGTVEYDDPAYFKPFLYHKNEFQYDGYLYVPRPEEDPALELFFSNTWNLLFSKIFSQPTSVCTSFAMHYHPPGNHTGFIHHDYALKWFSLLDRTENGVIYRERKKPLGLNLTTQARTIALLYYIDIGDGWNEGDGGETGLYTSKEDSVSKLVAPKDNRLFAFQISPRSFHAFQANHKRRATFIQWFHIDTDWCTKKYGAPSIERRS